MVNDFTAIIHSFSEEFLDINDLEVLTENGFKSFSGIKKSKSDRSIKLTFNDGSTLTCTPDHKVKINNEFISASEINDPTITKEYIVEEIDVFDLVEVIDGNHYITNKVTSHNCAFVEKWVDFASSVLPTIASNKKAKIIYTSTPNGLNHFYEYCKLAREGKNGFELVEVPWHKVDGRDDAWKEQTLRDLNYDYERFEVEYNLEFMGSSGTLISGATLKLLESTKPLYIHDNLKIYSDKNGNHQYAIIVDTSEGKGLDYSAFQVIDITNIPYEQVATFHSNTISPYDYSNIIHTVANRYNGAHILIELNCPAGAIVAEDLFWNHEYENILMTESAGRAGRKISSGFGGRNADRGVYTSTTVKATGCSILKMLIEQNQLLIRDEQTINELKTFSRKGKSYEAEENKHDDLVMGLVLFAWLSIQDYFKQITDMDVGQSLTELTSQEIDDYVSGLGIMAMNDGLDDFENSNMF